MTDEYTTAVTDLGSSSIDVRFGGVYLLQQLQNVPETQGSGLAAPPSSSLRPSIFPASPTTIVINSITGRTACNGAWLP